MARSSRERASLLFLTPFLHANRYRARITCGAGLRSKTLSRFLAGSLWSLSRIQQSRRMSPTQISGIAGDSGDLWGRRGRSIFLFEHDLFGKPVSTFPDHALGASRDLLLHAGEIFGGNRPLESIALLQALPIGGDVGPEILGKPDIFG